MIDFLHDRDGFYREGGNEEALALIGAHTADFVATNDIGSIVFLDTSARNAHIPVSAALKQLHPDHKVDFYFINPTGLTDGDVVDDLYNKPHLRAQMHENIHSTTEVRDNFMSQVGIKACHATEVMRRVEDGYIREGFALGQEEINARLQEKRAKLNKIATNPDNRRTLIFDQCIHKGISLRVTKETLASAFPDQTFFTGVVEHREHTRYMPDLVIFDPSFVEPIGCTYFGNYSNGTQIGRIESDPDAVREQLLTDFTDPRRELARICSQLDYS